MTKELSDMTKEDVQIAIETFLKNGSAPDAVEAVMEIVCYAKDQKYWNFPNGKTLGYYDGAVFEKAMNPDK